jgi:hypothetical protein
MTLTQTGSRPACVAIAFGISRIPHFQTGQKTPATRGCSCLILGKTLHPRPGSIVTHAWNKIRHTVLANQRVDTRSAVLPLSNDRSRVLRPRRQVGSAESTRRH